MPLASFPQRSNVLSTGSMVAIVSAAPANASSPAPAVATPANLVIAAQTLHSTVTNSACVQAVEAAQRQGQTGLSVAECTSTVTTQTSAASVLTASDLAAARSTLSASDYASLAVAAATSTIQRKFYSQKVDDGPDQVEQQGNFYYNGSRVWVGSYAGYTGSHVCIVDFDYFPVTTTITGCPETGSLTSLTLIMYWNVTVGPVEPLGANWNESYTMRILASGGIVY